MNDFNTKDKYLSVMMLKFKLEEELLLKVPIAARQVSVSINMME